MAIHVDELIRAAIDRGELKNLPGRGKPLDLEEDTNVPPEHRMAFRILKNSGFVPPEVEELKQIEALEADADRSRDPGEQEALRRDARSRRAVITTRIERFRHR